MFTTPITHTISILGCLSLSMLSSSLYAKPNTSTDVQIVKIGHGVPLTGGSARMGADNDRGAKMAIDELNAKDLVIDGKHIKFELISLDDRSNPAEATRVADTFVDAKVALVIGHLNSGTTIPAAVIYNHAGIPQISPSATNPKYTQYGFTGAFRMVANDEQLGQTLGKYAVEKLKGKNIVLIDDSTAYGQGTVKAFKQGVEVAGGKIIDIQSIDDKRSDFNNILPAIKTKKPDIVFFGGMDEQAEKLLTQMRQQGIKAKFMGGDGICSEDMAKNAPNNTAFCAEAGGVDEAGEAKLKAYKEKFKAKFNEDVQVYAPYVYDAVYVGVKAMQEADSVDPAKYLPKLKAISYDGVTGKIEFDHKGDIKHGAFTFYTYQNKQRVKIAVIRNQK